MRYKKASEDVNNLAKAGLEKALGTPRHFLLIFSGKQRLLVRCCGASSSRELTKYCSTANP